MLYFKALQEGLSALPAADPAIRARLDARAAAEGWPALHAELARVDPVDRRSLASAPTRSASSARSKCTRSPAGRCRSCRARGKPAACRARRSRSRSCPEDRARLHRTIAERFDAMLDAGLVAELAALRARHALTPDMPSMRCVGYRQAWAVSRRRASMPRRCAQPASPRRASWRSASSRGSARRRRAAFEPSAPDLADTRGGVPGARGAVPRLTADCCRAIIHSFDCRRRSLAGRGR